MKKLRTTDRHNDAYLHGFHDALANVAASQGLLAYGRPDEVTMYTLGYVDGLLALKKRRESDDTHQDPLDGRCVEEAE
ncbi:MAG: hypothetical protein ACI4SV_06055 [Duodenibacillus sp.]